MAVTGLSRGGSEKLTFVSVKDLNRIQYTFPIERWNILVRIVPEYKMCCSLIVSALGPLPRSRGIQFLLFIKPFTVSLQK